MNKAHVLDYFYGIEYWKVSRTGQKIFSYELKFHPFVNFLFIHFEYRMNKAKILQSGANFETAEEELIGDCYFSCNVAYIMSRSLCNFK